MTVSSALKDLILFAIWIINDSNKDMIMMLKLKLLNSE